MTLTEFLCARLDEDEAASSRAHTNRRWAAITNASYGPQVRVGDGPDIGNDEPEWQRETNVQVWRCDDEQDGCPDAARGWIAEAEHIARHDPARVLAEVDAKRRLLDWLDNLDEWLDGDRLASPEYAYSNPARKLLALPYADHPDYDESWRP